VIFRSIDHRRTKFAAHGPISGAKFGCWRLSPRLLKLVGIRWSSERDEDLPEVLQKEEATHGEQEKVAADLIGEEDLQQEARGIAKG